jgi:hypothetical protein
MPQRQCSRKMFAVRAYRGRLPAGSLQNVAAGAEPIFEETWLGMTQPATSHIAEHIQLFEENAISLL